VDVLLSLASPWAYLAVFAFAFAEGGLLIGLFLPGEAPILVAGALAFQGRVSIAAMAAVAAAAAVAGDSAGYWLGRRYGVRLESTALGRKIGDHRWATAKAFLRRRGGKAVFLCRFVSIFRTLVPPVAGMAGMPYRRFVAFNAPAAALFGAGLVLAGYVAGGSWRVIEGRLGQASFVVVVLVAIGVLLALGGRWVAGHYRRVRELRMAVGRSPAVRSALHRYDRQIAFLLRRFDRSGRLGLVTTIAVAVVLGAGLAFGVLLEEVIERETAFFDEAILMWLADHRDPLLTDMMRVVTFFGGVVFTATALTAALLIAYVRSGDLKLPAFLTFALMGGIGLAPVVKLLVGRPRPDFSQLVDVGFHAFPSGHATSAAVVCAALAYVLTRHQSWSLSVWIWTAAGMVAFLIGFSRLYLGVHWPTDVLAGWLLGLAWVAAGAIATELLWDREQSPTSRHTSGVAA
jgi:membrane protein DedA with SNARE-associated domain/membrane-associated phospholipid phosphatase